MTVQLAANAGDKKPRALMVELMNELQPEVNALYESEECQELKAAMDQEDALPRPRPASPR